MEVASSVSSLTSNIETQNESVDVLSNLYCSDCSNSNSNDSEIINMLELNEIREIIVGYYYFTIGSPVAVSNKRTTAFR